ncbi:TetR-like C-terminal domain-containing protein [Salinibacterium sp. GXW1014]|uniref:TetR-like C-terminal domain-containing protein n=1 Tax=Salinibacterium sp. GXW1014 TaxID=3377838 RepID=UPI00383BF53F
MARAGLDYTTVVERGAQLLDTDPANLSLAALAEQLGVRAPSLYKHVDGLPALQRGIMLRAKQELAEVLGRATMGRSRDDAVRAMARTYRAWAVEHPGQYPLTVRADAPGDEDDARASGMLVEIIFAVLRGYNLEGDDAVDATRFLRSALHGFIALETGGAFALPRELERSFEKLTDSVVTALATW